MIVFGPCRKRCLINGFWKVNNRLRGQGIWDYSFELFRRYILMGKWRFAFFYGKEFLKAGY